MKIFASGKSIFCALSVCALMGVTSASAQDYSIRANVPFNFRQARKMYPAGDYRFTVDGAVHTLKIQSRDNSEFAVVPLTPAPSGAPLRPWNMGW